MADLYTTLLDGQLGRLFGMLDRAPGSPTYGSLDRAYWHLKLASDFPGATWQQPALALAWLAEDGGVPAEGVSAAQAAAWARAAMTFWARIQNRDGSFNEWYDQEHSYCPTAFTTFAASEALLALRGDMPAAETTAITAAIERACRWLARRRNPWVENQNMAALNAQHNAWLLTGHAAHRAAAEAALTALLATQDGEGWFPEYGGADLGYSLLGVDLLAPYWAKTGEARVAAALDRLIAFIDCFVLPDGSVADLGSRGTQHAFPYGLELLAHRGHEGAGRVLGRLHAAASAGRATTPARVDDRYFAYFYANSYVGAARSCRGVHGGGGPRREGCDVFARAGLGRWTQGARTVVIAAKRGGMLRVFAGDRLLYADAGYHVALRDGAWGFTAGFDAADAWSVGQSGETPEITARGRFHRGVSVARLVAPFRALSGWVLRSGAVADRVHAWLKSREVATSRRLPLSFARTIQLEEAAVIVTDHITADARAEVVALIPVEEGRVAHSPSAGFHDGMSGARLRRRLDSVALANALRERGAVVVRTVVPTAAMPADLEVSWR